MVDITKLDMTDIWASGGDKIAPNPEKIAQGWLVEAVPRQTWNWFENRQDQNIAYLLQKGIPEWDATTEYLINKTYVQCNGVVYKCIATNTNNDPATATAYWRKAFVDSTAYLEKIKDLAVVNNTTSVINGSGVATNVPYGSVGLSLLAASTQAAGRTAIDAQQLNTHLTALAGLTSATNLLPYFNGVGTMATTAITAFGRELLDDADAAAGRATLDVPSNSDFTTRLAGKQPLDATLTALAGVTTAANQLIYSTGSDTFTTTSLTLFGRSLLDDLGATEARSTLGLGSMSVQPSSSVSITGGTIVGITDLAITDGGTGASDAATARSNLGANNATNLTTGTVPAARLSGSYTINVSGNSSTATTLQTARNINGVSFNGSSDITIEDATKLPVVGGVVTGTLTAQLGTDGGYNSTTGTGTNWASDIWSIGPVNSGTAAGSGYSQTAKYGLSWIRDGHGLYNATIGEGVYTYSGNTLVAGLGSAGIYTSGVFSGKGSGLTALNANNISAGTLAVARGGTGSTSTTGTGSNVLSISPTLTGVPLAPTATSSTNTTQIATTAFVNTVVTANAKPPLAWVNFNGAGTVTIRSSFNVSSITDNGTGSYTVNFTNAMPNTNYIPVFGCSQFDAGGTNYSLGVRVADNQSGLPMSKTVNALLILAQEGGGINFDAAEANVVIFGG